MKKCDDCGMPRLYHIQTWLEEFTETLFPRIFFGGKSRKFSDILLEKIFSASGLVRMTDDFAASEIQMRSVCFIEEARKRGVKFKIARGPFGYTNHFCAEVNGKKVRFESLPIAEFQSRYNASFTDSKERTKRRLKDGSFPVAEGRSFWFYERRKALRYGEETLGFPLVVKPRGGTFARHVTIDVNSKNELRCAINRAICYSPVFIVEKFVKDAFVHRATVVDFEHVFCLKQVPANVVGDGVSAILKLIAEKNKDKARGDAGKSGFLLRKIIVDDETLRILAKGKHHIESVPAKNEVVFLQAKPILRLGGDLEEVTEKVHPANRKLFQNVAKFFDMRLVGIDFMAQDISQPWQDQTCAVLELNSLPCIEMHHFPSKGTPQNVGAAVADLFFKYYV